MSDTLLESSKEFESLRLWETIYSVLTTSKEGSMQMQHSADRVLNRHISGVFRSTARNSQLPILKRFPRYTSQRSPYRQETLSFRSEQLPPPGEGQRTLCGNAKGVNWLTVLIGA